MRVLRISIKNFRSIHEISNLDLEKDITTIVGANEHGKSNILRAISFLDVKVNFDEKDKRIDSSGESFSPSISFSLNLEQSDREKLLKDLQVKYPPPSGIKTLGSAESTDKQQSKYYHLDDMPEKFEYVRTFDEKGQNSYLINVEDEELKQPIYEIIKNDLSPKIIFFDDFTDRLTSSLTRDEIIAYDKNLIIRGLLKVSGLLGHESKIFSDDRKTGKLFEQAQQKLTQEVKKNWFQGNDKNDDIKIKLRKSHGGTNLFVEVEDRNTFVDFDARSRGFKWFLSFFLKYRAHHDGDLKNAIFIMDEPALFLHPKGQKDLLNYIEKLGRENQVIYSTHSPFMINRLNGRRVRVVEKKFQEGTVINSKGFTANWRHLRTSLGIVLSDSFYFADKTLIVEGQEDVIYITALLKYFIETDKLSVDVNLLSILSAGGVANVYPMVQIVKEEERPLIVLIDSDSQKVLNRLEKNLKRDEFSEIRNFESSAISIQDLLPKTLYEKAVNQYIGKLLADNVLKSKSREKKDYKCSTDAGRDKEVSQFVIANFEDVDKDSPISKVGIAREFEEVLQNGEIPDPQWEFARGLTNWVINTLELRSTV